MNKIEFKSWIVLVFFISVSILFFFLFNKFLSAPKGIIYLVIFFIYVVFTLWIGNRYSNTSNKTLRIILLIISTPLAIAVVIIDLIHPITTILMTIFLFIMSCATFPAILAYSISVFYPLTINMAQFIMLTLSSLIAIAFHKYILKIVIKMMMIIQKNLIKDNHSLELINYTLKLKNIRFMIYIAYFVYMAIYSFILISNNNDVHYSENNIVILQAFLVFLAFDNVLTNAKEVKFLASFFVKKYLTIIDQHGIINSNKEKTKTPPSSS